MIWYLSDSFSLSKIKEFLSISSVSSYSGQEYLMIHRLDKNQKGEYIKRKDHSYGKESKG